MKRAFLVVLPARLDSTRLPRKPLALLGGVPMILRSFYNAMRQAGRWADVVVATDSEEIAEVCRHAHAPVVMTGCHPTGTDRVAEAASQFHHPWILNYQPDEPRLAPGVLRTMADAVSQKWLVCCGMAACPAADVKNPSVGKVALGLEDRAVYISRAPIMGAGGYWTQVCVYAFGRGDLEHFHSLPQGPLEKAEGIELLRLTERGYTVQMVRVPGQRMAVDTPSDLRRMRGRYL
jgi:3-deoxy-manno-octulosonate cytidylyltransferase (CMP-KDO synthetase)